MVRGTVSLVIVVAVVLANLGVSRFFPNVPTVDSRTVVIDTVRRGEFVHRVRGVGQLVSEDITERSARTKAFVNRIVVLPGVDVEPDTLILELRNSETDRALADARSKLGEAEAELVTQKAKLDSELIQLESAWRKLEADHAQADAKYQVSLELWNVNKDTISRQQLAYEKIAAESLLKQRDLAKKAYERFGESIPNHLAIYQERIAQAKTDIERETENRNSLQVLAGVTGVLAQVPVTVGQQVDEGELVAKIVNPRKLKAQLRVAEVEAWYLRVGQLAEIDAHHGIMTGTVARIDPEVDAGSVTIDVSFGEAELPGEVRPDLSVTGLVEVDRLDTVVWVGRPASAMAVSKSSIFRCLDSDRALRTPVEFGMASANAIVVRLDCLRGEPSDPEIGRHQLVAEYLGRPCVLRKTLNPHSGCFFLNEEQMEMWTCHPQFLDRSTKFAGPLESAATYSIARAFAIYKPSPRVANFLEVKHFGNRYIRKLAGMGGRMQDKDDAPGPIGKHETV